MNHYPRHVGDYLRGTGDLTMLEDGAFTRLLDQYYARDEPLPADKSKVYRMARASSKAEKVAVDTILDRFFVLTGDCWRNKRADLELDAQRERSASASESAKRRWEKQYANGHANAMRTHMPTHNEGICEPDAKSMLASNQEPKKSKTLSAARTEQVGFEAFWSAYPPKRRRVAKAKCLKVWITERLEPLAETILQHVVGMARTKQWQDGYEPAPLTYLNQRRWEDGLPTTPDATERRVAL